MGACPLAGLRVELSGSALTQSSFNFGLEGSGVPLQLGRNPRFGCNQCATHSRRPLPVSVETISALLVWVRTICEPSYQSRTILQSPTKTAFRNCLGMLEVCSGSVLECQFHLPWCSLKPARLTQGRGDEGPQARTELPIRSGCRVRPGLLAACRADAQDPRPISKVLSDRTATLQGRGRARCFRPAQRSHGRHATFSR